MLDMTYAQATAKAAALKEIGQGVVYLRKEDDLPWHLATHCESGSSYRLNIPVSAWVHAFDPETGLAFRWSLDLEGHGANGASTYEINVKGCRKAMQKMPAIARDSLREWLMAAANAVREKGVEYQKVADQQFVQAKQLSDLCAEEIA